LAFVATRCWRLARDQRVKHGLHVSAERPIHHLKQMEDATCGWPCAVRMMLAHVVYLFPSWAGVEVDEMLGCYVDQAEPDLDAGFDHLRACCRRPEQLFSSLHGRQWVEHRPRNGSATFERQTAEPQTDELESDHFVA
jgi:hypothetical protein